MTHEESKEKKYLILGYDKKRGTWEPYGVADYADKAEEAARDYSHMYWTWFKVEEVSEDDPRVRTPGIARFKAPTDDRLRHWFYTLSIRPPSVVSKTGALALHFSRTRLFIPSTDVEAVRNRIKKAAMKLKK